MHYRRQVRDGDPGEATPRYAVAGSTKTRECVACGGSFLLMEFPRCANRRRSKLCAGCFEVRAERRRENAELTENDLWRSRNLRRYGITLDEFAARLAAQGGRCLLCHTDTPGGQGHFHVDHCHDTNRVRGLLCSRCNVGIGMLGHDVGVLRRAIDYLSE